MTTLKFLTIDQLNMQDRAQAIFDRFEKTNGVLVQGQFDNWETLWRDLVNTGIYRKGADVSEVGSSWLDSLVEMNALKPFSSHDVALMGGPQAFVPSVWETMRIRNKPEIWCIPVRCDPRVLWYWKDMVEGSGLDPQQAFSNFERFPETMEKLMQVKATPWGVATRSTEGISVHTLASWVWEAGGEFVSEDGNRVLFMEPKTLQAITAYFDLYRYMPHDANITSNDVREMFRRREIAAAIGGPWLIADLLEDKVQPEQMARLGVTTIPGPSFLGGSVLVIWQHSREYEKAVQFVHYLVSPQVQAEYAPLMGFLPTRQETWKLPPYSTDPIYQTYYRALLQGRGLPTVPLWGMIEDRLKKTISFVWSELFTNKNPDTTQVVSKHFGAYARHLSMALGQ